MKTKDKIQERLKNKLQSELDHKTLLKDLKRLKRIRRLKALLLESGTLHWR